MNELNNLMLFRGERLMHSTPRTYGSMGKDAAYNIEDSIQRLSSGMGAVAEYATKIPGLAKPDGLLIARAGLHPRYISKSDYPDKLLDKLKLRVVGSRRTEFTPSKYGKANGEGLSCESVELFVCGTEESFVTFSKASRWTQMNKGTQSQLTAIEYIQPFESASKVKDIRNESTAKLEIVLQSPQANDAVKFFRNYVSELGGKINQKYVRPVGALHFVPTEIEASRIEDLSHFTFVRIIRSVPKLRSFNVRPVTRRGRYSIVGIGNSNPISPTTRVAVFDGGIPNDVTLPWVTEFDAGNVGDKDDDCTAHGLMVTSALSFGSFDPDIPLPQPHFSIDHYRVIGKSVNPDYEEYEILDRILSVLEKKGGQYDLINLSLGPAIPVLDDHITLWTATIDAACGELGLLATVAAGNDGESDSLIGADRIQPPSDGVNILAVGATSDWRPPYKRASYSSRGPGRHPGRVKPDLMAFGGSSNSPFIALASQDSYTYTTGTSFSAPSILRTAAILQSELPDDISALALKTILIHHASSGEEPIDDFGWGLVEESMSRLLKSDDSCAQVLFEGQLQPGEYNTFELPVPDTFDCTMVEISGTVCITSDLDAEHPSMYTKSGVDIIFRPDATKRSLNAKGELSPAATATLFGRSNPFQNEIELRNQSLKWETVLKGKANKRVSSLDSPVLDIYHNEREQGHTPASTSVLQYAMLLTIKGRGSSTLYQSIATKYEGVLVPVQQPVQVPVSLPVDTDLPF